MAVQVSIFGKDASRIFINGRDPMIGLDATMEMLRATPPSHIVRIEIIIADALNFPFEAPSHREYAGATLTVVYLTVAVGFHQEKLPKPRIQNKRW